MPRALIIDDDPTTKDLFRDVFADIGADFDTDCSFAGTDDEALEIILSGAEFDIAFIAIDREPISGMSLFHEIKDRTFRVPRVALTSGTDLSLIRGAMNQGAVDFLVKPINSEDFADTLDRVLETVERRRRNWNDRAEFSALKKEVDIAADIQQKILPTEFPEVSGYEFAAGMRPAKSMGGDFYDIFAIPDGRTGIVVADVSGKGVPAAFYMAVARTLIRSVAMTPGVSPSDCLYQVNDLLCAHHIAGMFVSVFYAAIDPRTSEIHFANGGHQLPFKGGIDRAPEELAGGHGVVLGIMPDMEYEEEMVTLGTGDYLYVYTDGASEAFNAAREALGEEGLAEGLSHIAESTAEEIVNHVNTIIDDFVGEADQHDDITSLVVRRTKLRLPPKR
jgi:phosphoserine phosphatase RsbU/P